MTSAAFHKFQRPDFQFSGSFSTIIVDISKNCISHFCSMMEACDNLALVRTMEPGIGRLWIYTNTVELEIVKQLIQEFGKEFPISIHHIEEGMKGLDESSWD